MTLEELWKQECFKALGLVSSGSDTVGAGGAADAEKIACETKLVAVQREVDKVTAYGEDDLTEKAKNLRGTMNSVKTAYDELFEKADYVEALKKLDELDTAAKAAVDQKTQDDTDKKACETKLVAVQKEVDKVTAYGEGDLSDKAKTQRVAMNVLKTAYDELIKKKDYVEALKKLDELEKAAKAVKTKADAKKDNNTQAAALFGAAGSKFADLTGSADLNKRQKEIFDEKLKAAVDADPAVEDGDLTEDQLKALAQTAADVANNLAKTNLGDEVNELLQKSDSLKTNIVELQNQQWTIELGVRGGGTYCIKESTLIVIDENDLNKIPRAASNLAHETRHALFTPPPKPSIASCATGEEYIRQCVEVDLIDEGEAQITACKAALEVKAAGGGDLPIPGEGGSVPKGAFMAIYDKIGDGAGKITVEEARKQMGALFATLRTSGENKNYIDHYSQYAREDWNAAHPDPTDSAKRVAHDAPRVTVFPAPK